jgi:hypothetical protein
MKLEDAVKQWAIIRPHFFMVAGDHPFRCTCNDCACFLLDGIRLTVIDDNNRPEDWPEEDNTPADDIADLDKLLRIEVDVDGQWLLDQEHVALFHHVTGALL